MYNVRFCFTIFANFCHFLKPIVKIHISKVTNVAVAVIVCAWPVSVRVAITKPTKVQLRFKVSFMAITSAFHNFLINQIS